MGSAEGVAEGEGEGVGVPPGMTVSELVSEAGEGEGVAVGEASGMDGGRALFVVSSALFRIDPPAIRRIKSKRARKLEKGRNTMGKKCFVR